MPLTFAHPAVVLPFGGRNKRGLSLTGLVIGSMVPDFEYFLRMRLKSTYSHQWDGLLWFDIPLGVALVIIYELWIKSPLMANLPSWLNRRVSRLGGYRDNYTVNYLLSVFIAVAIGAATHILWDSFTHPTGSFVKEIHQLRHIVKWHGRKFPVYSLLQYAGSLFGGLFILILALALPKGQSTRAKSISGFWLQLLLVMIVVVVIRLAMGLPLKEYGNIAVTVIDGGLLGLIVASFLNR